MMTVGRAAACAAFGEEPAAVVRVAPAARAVPEQAAAIMTSVRMLGPAKLRKRRIAPVIVSCPCLSPRLESTARILPDARSR